MGKRTNIEEERLRIDRQRVRLARTQLLVGSVLGVVAALGAWFKGG